MLLLGIISFSGIVFAIDNKSKDFLQYIVIMSLLFSFAICYKIYKTRFYLTNFYAENGKVRITYLRYSKTIELETTLSEIDITIINTTSR